MCGAPTVVDPAVPLEAAFTVMFEVAVALPPGPVTTSVSTVAAVGVSVTDPDVPTLAPFRVADVAFVLLQVTVVCCPAVTAVGVAEMVAVGRVCAAGVTVIPALAVAVCPLEDVTTRFSTVDDVGAIVYDPATATALPFNVAETASVLLHVIVVCCPAVSELGDAEMLAAGVFEAS
jgi:hypothetical protein